MKNIKRFLTARYLIGLTLIAATLLATHFMQSLNLEDQKIYSTIINMSGTQRMLSQRIPKLIFEVEDKASDPEKKEKALMDLQSSITVMRSNHEVLLNYVKNMDVMASQTILPLYFGRNRVDKKTRGFLSRAESFVRAQTGSEAYLNKETYLNYLVYFSDGLLVGLTKVVNAFEDHAVQAKQAYLSTEKLLLLLSFFILFLEVIFIFRPMVNQVVEGMEGFDKKNKELLEFTYRISHDLKSPISSSIGVIGIMKDEMDSDWDKDEITHCTGLIESNMIRLKKLIEDILNVTKVSNTEVKKELTSLDDIKANCETLMSAQDVKGGDIDIMWNLGEQKFFAEKFYIAQSLENLLSNAIKYSDLSKDKSWIKVSSKIDKNICTISVEDNGLGISEKHQKDIFKMFNRFHPKVSEGSGLGLYLVKKNIEAVGGQVQYSPAKDGSNFEISFPIK